jgi:hypothetical protein
MGADPPEKLDLEAGGCALKRDGDSHRALAFSSRTICAQTPCVFRAGKPPHAF